MTSVRLLNGDDMLLQGCATIDEVKVKLAIEFRSFAPNVAVFCRETGRPLADTGDELPGALSAVLRNVTYDKATWKDTLWLHACFHDSDGVGRAMEAIDRDVRGATEAATGDAEDRVIIVSTTYAGEVLLEHIGMCFAQCSPHYHAVDILMSAKAAMDIANREGANALLIATRRRLPPSLVERLLEARSEVNATDNNGRSPLMLASEYGDIDSVTLLLRAGARVNAMQEGGSWRTSLSRAAGAHHRHVVHLLLDAGADANSRCHHYGWASLHYACLTGKDVGVIERLLECEAVEVNAGDHKGCTPLHVASKNGHRDNVVALLRARADPNVDHQTALYGPLTPLAYATKFGYPEIGQLLVDAGGVLPSPRSKDVNMKGRSEYEHMKNENNVIY